MGGVRPVCQEDSTQRRVRSCLQPGGSFPLPVPPDSSTTLPTTLIALPFVSGQRWAVLQAHFHHGGALRPTGSGMAGKDGGKGGSGVPTVTAAGPPPPSVTAPGSSTPQIQGLREPDLLPRSPSSWCPPLQGHSCEGAIPMGTPGCNLALTRFGGASRPSHCATTGVGFSCGFISTSSCGSSTAVCS